MGQGRGPAEQAVGRGLTREPLHRQLERALRQEIDSGRLAQGALLPSEPELGRRYGISRATVRQALGGLAATGLVRRVPGKGTFVAATEPQAPAGRSGPPLLGLVVAGLHGMFLAQILDGIRRAAAQAGATITLAAADLAPGQEETALREVRAQGAAGAIMVSSPTYAPPPAFYRGVLAEGFPLVFLDRCPEGIEAASVTSNNAEGGRLLALHLLRLGHRSFGYVLARDYPVSSAADRLEATRTALAAAGLTPRALQAVTVGGTPAEPMRPYVRQATDALLTAGDRPTAILCTNDELAMDVLAAVREHGLRVPEDIALAGFDDVPYSELIHPPLTTVRQFPVDMGARATALLLSLVRERRTAGPRVLLPVELCVRASTAPGPAIQSGVAWDGHGA